MRTGSTIALTILAALAIPAPAAAQLQRRVELPRGSNSIVITGTVRGRQYVDYLVNVRAGERLSVSLTSNHRSAYFNLIAPGPGNAYYVGSSSSPPNRFDGVSPQQGLQRIRVYLYRASGRRLEIANFQLYVSVGGRPGWNNPVLPGPAYPNPGQNYRPGGPIECRLPGMPYGQCTASVQHLGPGSAYVRIRLPNGIVRTVTYANGQAIGIDSGPPGGSFIAQKRQYDTIVEVGGEVYFIPDAMLFAR
jgi:hypothetical protein